ncbi:hypothetical protein [Methylobacterium sp. J-077]|uniref:hypothetical protein n=1 Tax=Methylobacterium sp. J-077 TaxID=2836656 RepID=UPI001FB8BFB4|nr:hypothetical protein [Methylobacterium sp. J-077]MCJ2125113.1 hypothetical protein [Methylobacterium sp. J-077]
MGLNAEPVWLPMEIAPRDRRIDIRAERWVADHDRMRVEVFAGCRWCKGGTVRHPAPYWRRLPTGWTATGWREVAL